MQRIKWFSFLLTVSSGFSDLFALRVNIENNVFLFYETKMLSHEGAQMLKKSFCLSEERFFAKWNTDFTLL